MAMQTSLSSEAQGSLEPSEKETHAKMRVSESSNAEQRAECQDLNDKIESLKDELANEQSKLRLKEAELQKLSEDLQESSNQLSEKDSQLQSHKDRLQALEICQEASTIGEHSLQTALDEATADLAAKSAQLEELFGDLKRASTAHNMLEGQNKIHTDQIESLSSTLDNANERLVAMKEECARLEEAGSAVQHESVVLEISIAESAHPKSSECESKEAKALKDNIKMLEHETNDLLRERAEARNSVHHLQAELQELRQHTKETCLKMLGASPDMPNLVIENLQNSLKPEQSAESLAAALGDARNQLEQLRKVLVEEAGLALQKRLDSDRQCPADASSKECADESCHRVSCLTNKTAA